MKGLKLLFLVIGICLVTLATLPIQSVGVEPIKEIELVLEAPVIYQANFTSSILDFFKSFDLGSIISLLLAGGFVTIFASFKKAKKEIFDVVSEYKKAMSDGKIDEKEAEKLIKELEEAIQASTKLWYLVTGVFKKKELPK